MSDNADPPRDASDWFTIMSRATVTQKDIEAFTAWRRDPKNDAAFERVKQAWEAARGVSHRPAIEAAVAAAMGRHPDPTKPASTPTRRPGQFVLQPIAFGTLAVLVVVASVLVWRSQGDMFTTRVGEQRIETLADGSQLRLNTDTKVRVRLRKGERLIALIHGEAFFDVAHDAHRPFIVEADGVEIRALGTRFDVRDDGDTIRVTLTQGRVEVRGKLGGSATLVPGEAVVADRDQVSRPAITDADAASSWTRGRITLRGVPLRDAVAEVNRYSRRKVVLDAPEAVAGEQVSGQFVAGDIANFVAGATSLYGLRVVSESPEEIRLAPEG